METSKVQRRRGGGEETKKGKRGMIEKRGKIFEMEKEEYKRGRRKNTLPCTSEGTRSHQHWLEAINVYGIFGSMLKKLQSCTKPIHTIQTN
jgi:hypothetical protein